VLSILVPRYSISLLSGFHKGNDPFWLIHCFGEDGRAKYLIDEVFSRQDIMFKRLNAYEELIDRKNKYLKKFSNPSLRLALNHLYVEPKWSVTMLRKATQSLDDNSRLELLFDACDESSMQFDLELLVILIARRFPISKIIRNIDGLSLGAYNAIPTGFPDFLWLYCDDHEEFAELVVETLEIELAVRTIFGKV
jgi:hypothetical protein